jgi:hypothetical protein
LISIVLGTVGFNVLTNLEPELINIKGDPCGEITSYTKRLITSSDAKKVREYFDSCSFSREEYLIFVYCFLAQVIPPMHRDCYRDVFATTIDFEIPNRCQPFCNESRSSLPCDYKVVYPQGSLDHLNSIVLRSLKAAKSFSRYPHSFPKAFDDLIKSMWGIISFYSSEWIEEQEKVLEDVDRCVVINMEMKMYCDLGKIIFSPE